MLLDIYTATSGQLSKFKLWKESDNKTENGLTYQTEQTIFQMAHKSKESDVSNYQPNNQN